MNRARACALRAILWSAAYYVAIAVLAAYLGGIECLNGWQAALTFLPLAPLAGSCEIFFNKKLALADGRTTVWAAADCGAKCAAYVLFIPACVGAMPYGVGIGAAIAAAAFSLCCEGVLVLKADRAA